MPLRCVSTVCFPLEAASLLPLVISFQFRGFQASPDPGSPSSVRQLSQLRLAPLVAGSVSGWTVAMSAVFISVPVGFLRCVALRPATIWAGPHLVLLG